MTGAQDVDAYIAAFPADVRQRLRQVRATLLEHLPGGHETVRYDMPAVMLDNRDGLHFAGWKKHIGLYPVPVLPEPDEARVAPYRSGKDSVQLRHDRDLPLDVVALVCDHIARRS